MTIVFKWLPAAVGHRPTVHATVPPDNRALCGIKTKESSGVQSVMFCKTCSELSKDPEK